MADLVSSLAGMATYASGFERDTSSNNNPRRNTMKIFKLVIAARLLTMKYLLLMSTLTTSLMCSAGSWAEWTEVSESADGHKLYIDYDRIRKVNGLVYYWAPFRIYRMSSLSFRSSCTKRS